MRTVLIPQEQILTQEMRNHTPPEDLKGQVLSAQKTTYSQSVSGSFQSEVNWQEASNSRPEVQYQIAYLGNSMDEHRPPSAIPALI